MTPETTETISDGTESGQDEPKGFEDMAKVMERCGCGGMMEKMMRFMPAMCGSTDDGSGEAEAVYSSSGEYVYPLAARGDHFVLGAWNGAERGMNLLALRVGRLAAKSFEEVFLEEAQTGQALREVLFAWAGVSDVA